MDGKSRDSLAELRAHVRTTLSPENTARRQQRIKSLNEWTRQQIEQLIAERDGALAKLEQVRALADEWEDDALRAILDRPTMYFLGPKPEGWVDHG